MLEFLVIHHPVACVCAAAVVAVGVPAWLLRYEARYQARQVRARRRGGYLIGGRS